LKYEVNCSSAIVILFEPRPTISSFTEGGKEYSLIWISEFCLKDNEKGFMALSEVKSRIRGIPNILDIHIKHRENPDNCSSAIVILFEPRPTISSFTLGTGICSQANLIIFICRANVFPEPIGPRIICTGELKYYLHLILKEALP
jgi:hypothetical protein